MNHDDRDTWKYSKTLVAHARLIAVWRKLKKAVGKSLAESIIRVLERRNIK